MVTPKRSLAVLALSFCALFPFQATHAESLKIPSLLSFMPIVAPLPTKPAAPAPAATPLLTLNSFFPNLAVPNGFTFPQTFLSDLLSNMKTSCTVATSSTTVTPPPVTVVAPPATITFSPDQNNHWQFTAGFGDGPVWEGYLDPSNYQGAGLAGDPVDTEIPTTDPIEALLVNTDGRYLSDNCGKMTFTGNPVNDFACYTSEAKAQGYGSMIVLGQHDPLPPS